MLGSLRARLIVSFSLVVALAVFLAGAGSLFLLRDQQQETALERYGHVVDPLGVRVTAMLDHKDTLASIKDYLRSASNDYDCPTDHDPPADNDTGCHYSGK